MGNQEQRLKEEKKASSQDKAVRSLLFYDWPEGVSPHLERVTKLVMIDRGYEVFYVINGIDGEGAPVVAFDSSDCAFAGLVKVARKLKAGGYKWKIDRPRGEGS